MESNKVLKIELDEENNVIVGNLNFGTISTGGCEGIEIKKDIFEPLNIFYSAVDENNKEIIEHIYQKYIQIHALLITSNENYIKKHIEELVKDLISLHHYVFTKKNLFDIDDVNKAISIYKTISDENDISILEYLSLVELSLVLKIVKPIHSKFDELFEEEEDFAYIENLLFESIEDSLFGLTSCSAIIRGEISIYFEEKGISQNEKLINTFTNNIYLGVLPFIDSNTEIMKEIRKNLYKD